MKQLVDSVWPKDPLDERRKMQFGKNEANDLSDRVSHDQTNFNILESSDIKYNLTRIGAAETKLGAMIGRHIKKHGSMKFQNSGYVVTDRNNTQPRQKAQTF